MRTQQVKVPPVFSNTTSKLRYMSYLVALGLAG